MDKDEVRNKLEQLFQALFESDPVELHVRKINDLMTYGWDDDIALLYMMELKKKLL
jgi:hypothetical protein